MKSHVSMMNTLEANANKSLIGLLGSTSFAVVESENGVHVIPSVNSNESVHLYHHAQRLTRVANSTSEGEVSQKLILLHLYR